MYVYPSNWVQKTLLRGEGPALFPCELGSFAKQRGPPPRAARSCVPLRVGPDLRPPTCCCFARWPPRAVWSRSARKINGVFDAADVACLRSKAEAGSAWRRILRGHVGAVHSLKRDCLRHRARRLHKLAGMRQLLRMPQLSVIMSVQRGRSERRDSTLLWRHHISSSVRSSK